MSYTSLEQVRSHLIANFGSAEEVISEPFTMSGNDYVQFFTGAVRDGSIKLKTVKQSEPTRVSMTLLAGENSLAGNGVVLGSVAAASDSSLGTVYTENVDYAVAHSAGTISIKAGGALAVNDTVVVWFYPYQLYSEGIDYQINYESGELTRITAGGIADGETVYLNYSPEMSDFADELIQTGVQGANALIEAEIDPDREFGANPVLVSAATYRALEIICRAAAVRELASRRGMHQTANGWLNLAETYSKLAERWLKSFRPPATSPASPAIS